MSFSQRMSKYLQDWRSFPGDAALAYRNEGARGVWDAFATRSVHRVIRTGRMLVFAQPLDNAPGIAPPEGVVIGLIRENEWSLLATLVTGRDLDRFRTLVAAGRHCLVAWRGSRPIGYAWVAEGIGPDVTACPLPLPAHAAYLWDLYVLPAERCNGIGSALASARLRTARERGFREGWRTIVPSNGASLRTLQKSGSGTRLVGEMRYLKILTRTHTRFTPNQC